jgi:hypothetical protein
MSQISTVSIGSRMLDLYAFTGLVVDQNTSSETRTTVHSNRQVTSQTVHYAQLFVRAPDGEERDLEVANMKIGVRRDHTVSLLWGIRKGRESGKYIAVYNHDTKSIHHIRKENNDLAGPPAYALILIVAVFTGVFGLFGLFGGSLAAGVVVLLAAGAIYWIHDRQRKLMAAVDAAARAIPTPTRGAATAAR